MRYSTQHPLMLLFLIKKEQIKRLEQDKKNVIAQLVDYEELKSENERLRELLTARQI
jgi:cell shape-determining protein MreC